MPAATLLSLWFAVAPAPAPAQPRPAAEIHAELRLLQREEQALPLPDRTLELTLGAVGLLIGVPLLAGDVVYVLQNASWCTSGSLGSLPGGSCPPSNIDASITIPLLIAGAAFAGGGLISLIVGFARRADPETRARRDEIRERIRQDRIELRLQPTAGGALLGVAGSFG
jgi:hypothetical protein